jgi:hypothetical protein
MTTTASVQAERLNATLLTMDVVDQLRHRDAELKALAEKGLDDAGLKRRLAEIYRSQGIEVSESILDAGIAAQRERRYIYVAPTGLKAWLARQWIRRTTVAKRISVGFASVVASLGLFHFGWTVPTEHRAENRIAAWNTEVDGVAGRINATTARHRAAGGALQAALDRATKMQHADRLQGIRTDAAAQGRKADQTATAALGQLTASRTLPRLVRAEGQTRLVGSAGLVAVDDKAEEIVQDGLQDVEVKLTQVATASEAIEAASGTVTSAIDVSGLLDTANAAAVAAALPPDADAIRARELAAGDAALRAGDLAKARAAAGKIDGLGKDVAKLATIKARLEVLRREALGTGVAGEDLATFDLAHHRAESLAHIETVGEADTAVQDVADMVDLLSADYSYRIVNRSGVKSGVWRYSNDSPNVRNHYLVVEALDSKGEAATLPIRNEETGKTERVDVFAVRVPEEEYNRVGEDKKDNGLIEHDMIGKKSRGTFAPKFDIPTAGGFITSW